MTDAVVTFLLAKLSAVIEEEQHFLSGFRDEIKYIRDELESIRAFLRVADDMDGTDPELSVWVKQVREVARDIEDAVDEYMISLAAPHERGLRFYVQKVTLPFKRSRAYCRIAHQMVSIKTRVMDISKRHQRYQYRSSVRSSVMQRQGQSPMSKDDMWIDPRGNSLLIEESELIGVEKPRHQLMGWLVNGDSKLKVVSVVGMGGLGKTTLVKNVYDGARIKKYFDSRAWITISRSFDIEDLMRDMIQQLFEEIKQPVPCRVGTMNGDKLKAFTNEFLQQRSYLIVLDDVWSIHGWELVRYALPKNLHGSRIMITTRFADVASTCCMESRDMVYNLKPLIPEDSWDLFCKKAFRGNLCPANLEDIARQILTRCRGLPLAIVAISGILATKDVSRIDEWEMIRCNLGDELEGNDRLLNLRKILSLGFSDLPNCLQSCLLYVSIFPEDHIIGHMQLVRLWIAEGFIEKKEGRTLEEVAERYLFELHNRSLIQVARTTTDGRINAYRVHDILREILLTKAKQRHFAAIANPTITNHYKEAHRRIAVHSASVTTQWSMINTFRLRSLLVFGAPNISAGSSILASCDKFKLLEVLDLRGTLLDAFPNEIVELYNLKHLSIRGAKINKLPNSIGNLQKLETMDLKETLISELPASILRLRRLRHLLLYRYEAGLDLYYCKHGFRACAGIRGLVSLQKLCCIEADPEVIRDIGNMSQLIKLNITNLRKQDGKALTSSIGNLTKLRVLSLCSVDSVEVLHIEHLAPPRFLQRLYLEGPLEKMPSWISSLFSVVRLYLRHSRLQNDPLEALQALPNLVELQLGEAYEGKSMRFGSGGFRRLKLMWLIKLDNLKRVRMEEGTLPNLEKLTLRRCPSLKNIPATIERLQGLKMIVFDDMPEELFQRLNQDGDARSSRISKVFVRNGIWTRYV